MPHHLSIPASTRLLQVFCATVWCLLAAGPIFGFAALKTVWLQEGVYTDLCTPEENELGIICGRREIRINFVFTCASVVTNIAGVAVGGLLDRYGPKVCQYLGGILIAIGSVMLAFANRPTFFDFYVWGYIILAFGGPFVYISAFHLSNAFPAYSGMILALLTGAFDSSTAVYLFYRIIYDNTGGSFHPREFFLLYLVVPVFILGATYTVMPFDSYKPGGNIAQFLEEEEDVLDATSIGAIEIDSAEDEIGSVRRDKSVSAARSDAIGVDAESSGLLTEDERQAAAKDLYEYDTEELKKLKISGVWGVLHGRSAWIQIKTPWFILLCLFTMLMMLRLNYFVATIRSQYEFLFNSAETARHINSFFDVALPAGGVITVPIAGYLLDNYSLSTALAVLLTMAFSMGFLGLFALLFAAYGNIMIFVVFRSLFYTTISDFTAKVFGFDTFGKVYGLISTISGVFNFAQSGFDHMTHETFGDDPRPINGILLLVSTAIGGALVWYVFEQTKKIKRATLEMEAEQAVLLLPPHLD
ncbi:major facilitator superfamily domain-containing protein [Lipomyces arxii]|uniref:major facilitator superfamily domain-containing protein n=1 Tax=Lipomyces arxii TaxID=56418 RepID=UPI0034CF8B85